MDATLQLIILLAGGATALGILFKKVVFPTASLIVETKRMLPFLQHLPILADLQKVFPTLAAIAAEFSTNGGSTLKDDIMALRKHAEENRDAAAASMAAAAKYSEANRALIAEMQVQLAAAKELAADDRKQLREDRDVMRDAVRALGRVEESGVRTEASGERVEASGARTEAAEARMEAADQIVASDLAQREKRADGHTGEPPGAAADAAFQSAEEQDARP